LISTAEREVHGHLANFDFPFFPRKAYGVSVALARILVDGYSLLHSWPDLARGKPRYSAAARGELIHWLARYQDATGTPVTVFFDGAGARPGIGNDFPSAGIEVIYSEAGQTADQLIERVAHRLRPYGEVLVVTDDHAERDTVMSAGATASSCGNFIETLEATLDDQHRDVNEHNRRERNRFKQPRNS
jgi:uncharacterized protein